MPTGKTGRLFPLAVKCSPAIHLSAGETIVTQTLKAVLAGCGGISRAWLEPASQIENFEIAGFVDINEAAARTRAQEYGKPGAVVGTDLDKVLDQVQPDIVFDCTNPTSHFHVVTTAFKHGAHVLGEKPLADTLENAHKMIEASQQAGKLYSVMQNRRFDPNIRRVRALIETGQFGPLTMLNSDFFVGAHFGGFREEMANVLLIDMAIHTFDAARFISGAEAKSVYCKEWNPPGSWYQQDAAAVCIFEMSNDLIYVYRGSWCAEGLRTTWESDWRIIGQHGTILWPGDERIMAQTARGEKEGLFLPTQDITPPESAPIEKTGGHGGMIREFVEAVRNGTTPENPATDNIKSLAMVFAAIESAKLGKTVDVRW
jgi:predicted dehydrogenase